VVILFYIFPFWYVVPRKICQPWFRIAQLYFVEERINSNMYIQMYSCTYLIKRIPHCFHVHVRQGDQISPKGIFYFVFLITYKSSPHFWVTSSQLRLCINIGKIGPATFWAIFHKPIWSPWCSLLWSYGVRTRWYVAFCTYVEKKIGWSETAFLICTNVHMYLRSSVGAHFQNLRNYQCYKYMFVPTTTYIHTYFKNPQVDLTWLTHVKNGFDYSVDCSM
jgi:hypothetical protein